MFGEFLRNDRVSPDGTNTPIPRTRRAADLWHLRNPPRPAI